MGWPLASVLIVLIWGVCSVVKRMIDRANELEQLDFDDSTPF